MAKSKKHKRNSKARPVFYEAMPASVPVTPPVALAQVRELIVESSSVFIDALRQLQTHFTSMPRAIHYQQVKTALIQRLYPSLRQGAQWTITKTMAAGLTTSNVLIQRGQMALYAARTAGETTLEYTPPILVDLGSAGRRSLRALTSRRARHLYLAVTTASALTLVAIGAVTAASTVRSYTRYISSPAALLAKKKTGTVILDRNGQVLFEGYGAQGAKSVQLSDLPASLKDATLAAEDPSFYDHTGFSWRATARAAWVDFSHHGTVEGGSTLTQQLVKNALLTSTKDFERKYQELLLSMELEQHYSKDQILDMYLNEIYYGQGSSGVEAASETYFHKPAHDLTLGESALLAGLPLGPSRFDPNADPAAATGRRDYVLSRMLALGKVTKAQADATKAQPIQLASAGAPQTATTSVSPLMVYAKNVTIKAPWFVFYVLDQLRAQYGDDLIEQGGITVRTTLDLSKQQLAEQTVTTHVQSLASHHVTNGGLVSLEPATGNILAMVGSVDYNAPGFGNVNVTLSDLQPGSSFKPIAYATAFKKGWNGATTIDDVPFSAPNGDGTLYTPQNYDLRFHGTVTLRHALDNSLNIPAIKVLQFAGIPETLQTAHDLGITTLNDPSRYGLSLVLGGGEVRPIDMATVYGTFANNGLRVEPRAILSVTDRYGQDITKPTATKPQAAIDPRIAYMITNILSDDFARQPEFPLGTALKLSRPAAAKTGTTNDFRDNWTVGYTPQLVTAVWVGNNDHTAMQGIDGMTGAAPIWHDYMEGALSDTPVENFAVPSGITTAKVCPSNGGLADPWDFTATDEVFMSDAMPTKRCNSVLNVFQFQSTPSVPSTPPNAPTPPLENTPIIPEGNPHKPN
jgi:1A family penicillin-binding protein